ncbi:hypothetical protein WICMUC_001491 [Wickerhamomyces mucosus]|uniref:Uncharacterized protein n=1 Tax=Wickerhamomyces mucosus TaxID=1378264 RepID=A0A9P8PW55_9ASCO|nr:hypothetical protein WICMUC_001491 [Wickerhamomyces mucosus]
MSSNEVIKDDIVIPPKDDEELELEKLVFGDLKGFENNLKQIDNIYDEDYSFDDDSDNNNNNNSEDENDDQLENIQDDQLFFVDDGDKDQNMDNNEGDISDSDSNSDSDSSSDSDVWIDSEDENINISLLNSDKLKKLRHIETDSIINGKQYIQRLRSQFEKIYPRPNWADINQSDEETNSDDEKDEILTDDENEGNSTVELGDIKALTKILQSNTKILNQNQSRLLPPTKIDIIRLKDANQKFYSKSAIQTLSFHPTHPLLLTSGYDRSIRIYHIDGKNNNVVSTIHFKDSPIQTAQFNPNFEINKIFAGGRRRYMYSWDLSNGGIEKISRLYGHESTQKSFENFKISPGGNFIGLIGNSGWINILSSITSQWLKGFKIEGTIVDFDWSINEDFIVVINSIGEVWEFDLNDRQKIIKWKDETGVGITKIKLGGKNNKYCAIGSESGIVNIYNRLSNIKKPIGTLDQLITSISSLEFNNDGQILSIASRAKKDSLRLVHLPSCKVFQNWPTSGTPLGKVTAVKFSPNSEMVCIANEAGKARLWRLNHY